MMFGSWWRWILQPWRQTSIAVAVVGALGLPALLLASEPMFVTASSDEITVQVIAGLEQRPAGLIVQSPGTLDGDRLGDFAEVLEQRLGEIEGLGTATRTLLSTETALETIDGRLLEGSPGRNRLRLLSRPGAAASVDLLSGDRDGVLVPANLADTYGIEPGSVIGLGSDEVVITGVYRDVWDGTRDEFWDDLPRDMVPIFMSVFNRPEFELIIAPEDTVRNLGLFGRARWEAPLIDPPRTWVEFERLAGDYRSVERTVRRAGPVAERYRAWAAVPELPPLVFTTLFEAESEAEAQIERLEQHVRTAALAGTATGLLVSTLGAVFLVRRRRRDYRLLAADGDAAWRFFGRAAAQFALPGVVAAVTGAVMAWLVVRLLGPSGTATWSVVPWVEVVAASLLAVLLAAAVTAAISVRLVDGMEQPVGAVDWRWLLVSVGVAAAMWVQVGRERSDDVNPLIVAFPLVGIATGVLVTVAVLRITLRSLRRTGSRLPTSLFLAWRALTASDAGALLLTAALGLASGLAVLSVSFVGTIDTAIDAKAATVAGANSRLYVIDDVTGTDLPSNSTVVLHQSTRVGDTRVEVLAIDPATYADAVAWPDEFGGSPQGLLDVLATVTPGAIPAVAVDGRSVPVVGEFGTPREFPYRLVSTVASAPLASVTGPTLIVRADIFEQFALERLAQGADGIDRPITDRSPLVAYGNTVLSAAPLSELETIADQQNWRVRETSTLAGQQRDIDAQSTRWAFDYLGLLAVVSAVVAFAVMAFYLAERRRRREVAAVMTAQMGIGRGTNIVAAVAEMVGLVIAAIAAGAGTAAITARHVFPMFEPDPDVPPTVALIVDTTTVGVVFVVTVAVVAAIAAWSQRSVSLVDKAQVLRG